MPSKDYVERKDAEQSAKEARVRVIAIPSKGNPKLSLSYEIGYLRDPHRVVALSVMEADARKRAKTLTGRDPQLIDLNCTQMVGHDSPPYLVARFVFYVGLTTDAIKPSSIHVVGTDLLTLPGNKSEKTRLIELD